MLIGGLNIYNFKSQFAFISQKILNKKKETSSFGLASKLSDFLFLDFKLDQSLLNFVCFRC